ncbi:hypothetical protein QYF36_018079 [Acer negundo]|nr:hypothetical protein QYF36_018079 [Acer negundo]
MPNGLGRLIGLPSIGQSRLGPCRSTCLLFGTLVFTYLGKWSGAPMPEEVRSSSFTSQKEDLTSSGVRATDMLLQEIYPYEAI